MHRWTRLPPNSARAALCLGLALQLALPASAVLAATPTESPRAASRAAFLQAQKDYAAERYGEALEGYSEAHRLMPMPAFIFNMAQCQRLLQKPEEALALYRQYLTEEPRAKNRKTVEGFIAELETAVAALPPKAPVLTPSAPKEEQTPALAALTPPPAPAAAPLYKQWWFWTGVAVVAGGVATGAALAANGPGLPPASLGDVNLR